jgi:hypothetical protein
MRYHEILNEKSLLDVGVRGNKFYLAARSQWLNLDDLFTNHTIGSIRGISSSRKIWKEFGPNAGRDIFFVMNATSVLKANNVKRVQYDNVNELLKDKSKLLARIYDTNNFETSGGSNIVYGIVRDIFRFHDFTGDDPNTLGNNALSILSRMQQNGTMNLSSLDAYRDLLFQAASKGSWHTRESKKFFAPQNKAKSFPVIQKAIINQASRYDMEAEWMVSGDFIVPTDTHIIVAFGKEVMDPINDRDSNWSIERKKETQAFLERMKSSPYKYSIVDGNKTANMLVKLGIKGLPE